MAAEPSSRTLVLSVVAVDLVGYSRESVADQMALKRNFNLLLLGAITNISELDRIILDTGDSVAMGFLCDPEDALYVAMYLHINVNRDRPAIRIGINMGPVKLSTGAGGYPNIIGDGINVAERIRNFAEPGQLTASRPFYEVMTSVSGQYRSLFQHIGLHTDEQMRDHDVYLVGKSDAEFRLAEKGVKERASQRNYKSVSSSSTTATRSQPGPPVAPVSNLSVESNAALIDFLENGKKVAITATLLAVIALGLAATLVYRKTRSMQPEVNAPIAPTRVTAPEIPADAKLERSERKEKSPGETPIPDEIRKAIKARAAEREQRTPAATAPAIPNVQTQDLAPSPESVTPTPSLPPPEVVRPDTAAVIVERSDPAYPIEGIRQGILRTVIVKARLSIDARGSVTDVVILEGGPIAAFGRQTRMTLKDWKFNPGASGRSIDIEITFKP